MPEARSTENLEDLAFSFKETHNLTYSSARELPPSKRIANLDLGSKVSPSNFSPARTRLPSSFELSVRELDLEEEEEEEEEKDGDDAPSTDGRPRWWEDFSKRLHLFLDSVPVQILLVACLMLAMFESDLATMLSANDQQRVIVDWSLIVIISIFTIDFFLNCYARPEYMGSFFFWMDLFGTVAILWEVELLDNKFTLDHHSALAASRAARVGSKVGRFARLMTGMKWCFGNLYCQKLDGEHHERITRRGPSVIGQSLSETLSYQVTLLLLLTIIVLPVLTRESRNSAPDAYADLFQTVSEFLRITNSTTEQLDALVGVYYDHFSQTKVKPVEVWIRSVRYPFNGTTWMGKSWWTYSDYRADKVLVVRELYDLGLEGEQFNQIILGFDTSEQRKETALLSLLFNIYILMSLILFAGMLSAKATEMIVRPLERMLQVIQENASHLTDTFDSDLSSQSMDGALARVSKILKKMKQNHKTSNQDAAQSILNEAGGMQVDDETKAWLINLTRNSAAQTKQAPPVNREFVQARNSGNRFMSRRLDSPNTSLSIMSTIRGSFPSLNNPDLKGLVSIIVEENKKGAYNFETLMVIDHNVVRECEFDVFLYDKYQLFMAVYRMLQDLDLLSLGADLVPLDILWPFLQAVHNRYNPNAYHNFQHCIDVTQTLFRTLFLAGKRLQVNPLEKFAMIIGALAHDLGHPGVTNTFLVSTRNQLALTYNDASCLENFHVASLYDICQNPETDIMCKLESHEWHLVRGIIISTVVKTDTIHHFEMVSELEQFIADSGEKLSGPGPVDLTPEERMFVMTVILHSADISNPVKPFDVYEKWVSCVLTEFFDQGDKERELAMKLSPMMDRFTTSEGLTQINFIEFVVAPLYCHVVVLLPELAELMSNLLSNRARYGLIFDIEYNDEHTVRMSAKSLIQREEERRAVRLREDMFKEKYGPKKVLLKRESAFNNGDDQHVSGRSATMFAGRGPSSSMFSGVSSMFEPSGASRPRAERSFASMLRFGKDVPPKRSSYG
eukprot:CAMPEP_0198198780 /NCGR_PEP_ID=MMETSP1445-20131203/2170_1 /TAXON_ID=36898 /ORGANISM="Pyramimonas sp., Strain CCMP2087" /LENGTH=1016 /DNA_ID=CAMNT_0043868419 /DNA_START=573 /DNA_END=3623 /DNA_ORIENTATION=+